MNVLAVGAHPDDLEILCAGTLARYSRDGYRVIMAHICSGNKGHHHIPPGELAEIRDKEAVSSAKLIGAEHINLGIEDLGVYLEREQVLACVELIRRTMPDVIITHSPDDYMPGAGMFRTEFCHKRSPAPSPQRVRCTSLFPTYRNKEFDNTVFSW